MAQRHPEDDVTIRPAEAHDASRLLDLCQMLGRDASLDDVLSHLLAVRAEAASCLLVAVLDGVPKGFVEVTARTALGVASWAEVSGLVVDAALRGRGVGTELMAAARRWARQKGLARLRVRTRLARLEAARFYERAGLTKMKEQSVFEVDV
jgi:GNAT superfamily N-acetyltransferase